MRRFFWAWRFPASLWPTNSWARCWRRPVSLAAYQLTLNYTYRGLWGTILVTLTLFAVSWMTKKMPEERLEGVTIDWSLRLERFQGLRDWRLQLAVLSLGTVAAYAWLW